MRKYIGTRTDEPDEEVERGEHAEEVGLHEQHQAVKLALALVDWRPRAQDGERHEERGEDHEREADSIEPDEPRHRAAADLDPLDP